MRSIIRKIIPSSSDRQIELGAMLLAVVLSKMTPILSKALYSEGWDPPVLYFAVLLVTIIVLGAHEVAAIERGKRWGMTKRDLFGIVITTLTGGVLGPIFFFTGLRTVAASDSIVLTSLLPFFVVCSAVIFLKERFSRQTLIGGLFLFSSIVVILWPDISKMTLQIGAIFMVLSSIMNALTTIVHKKYVVHRHLDSIILVRTTLSAVFVGAWLLLTEPESLGILIVPQNLWLFLALPVCGFILPFFLYFGSLSSKHIKAMDAGFVSAMGRVIGIALAVSLLGETLTPYHSVSMVLMVAGIVVINVPLTKWRIVPSRFSDVGPLRK